MKLEDAHIDIDSIKTIAEELRSDKLKTIHERYCSSVEQILTLISSPLIFMTLAMSKVKEDHLSIQNAVKLGFLFNNPPKEPKDAAKQLVKFFEEELKKANENIVNDAHIESMKLYEKSEEIRNCFNNIGLNALVNSWTLFEAYSKDIWIKVLDDNPQFLSQKIINNKSEIDSGVNGKTIPLSILSKYNYNISGHLGEILSVKYDFTSVDGIKRAFKDLLNLDDQELCFLSDTKINQLEICRHIIVHNAGLIDTKYLTRSKRTNEVVNQKLQLDITEINDMINESIKCTKQLLLLTDRRINNR
jgi:hypothetical protein